MPFTPNLITKNLVFKAINKIEREKAELIPSTRWLVEINGKQYPPKEVMRYAHEQLNGERIWSPGGGPPTNKFLEAMGFNISDMNAGKDKNPVLNLLEQYKQNLKANGLKEEIYKWELVTRFKGKPDINALNFYEEIKGIDFRNLIYPVGISVIHHIAKECSEPYRECFKILFNENLPLQNRLKSFNAETLKIYRSLVSETRFSHHQDERTMATFLTYHNPEQYTFYKDSFYQKYCRLLGIKSAKTGEKYRHYLRLIDDLISDYINEDKELIELVKQQIPSDYFQDINHKLLAQDILFQTLDLRLGAKRNYWRVGTSDGESTSYWDEMKDDKSPKICIGWSKLGDLNDSDIKAKKDIESLLREKGYYKDDNRTLARKAGEIFNFYNDIKNGDVVLAQTGDKVLGIGIVNDEYQYEKQDDFPHQRGVEWKIYDPPISSTAGRNTTVYPLIDLALTNKIDALLESNPITSIKEKESNKMSEFLNQILFGPPGTGKPYNAINKALETIGENITGKTRVDIKALFELKVKEGQIMFTTFHQSMSYEDFIEGIKPIEPKSEGEPVNYKVVDGIFKRICAIAAYNCYKRYNESNSRTEKYSFDDLYNAFTEHVQALIKNNNAPVYKTLRNRDVEIKEINRNDSIIARAKNSVAQSSAPLTKENMQKLYDKFKTVEEIKDLSQVQETVGVTPRITEFYAVFLGLKQFETTFKPDELEIMENKQTEALNLDEIQNKFRAGVYNDAIKKYSKDADKVVLIIDEINRGNVSQVFGELITLIEEDKRLGNPEALEVILPYSKTKFGVPPNLHIIGTMNTADRSVEALDTALRRRFSFVEMSSDQKLIAEEGALKESKGVIDSISLPDLLGTINKRIEKLMDRDHLVGHSYFMHVGTLKDLKGAFQHKITPLLQEYFYGDYGKIGLVLGKGFLEEIKNGSENVFADFDDYDVSDFAERTLYRLKNTSDMKDDEFKAAIKLLLTK